MPTHFVEPGPYCGSLLWLSEEPEMQKLTPKIGKHSYTQNFVALRPLLRLIMLFPIMRSSRGSVMESAKAMMIVLVCRITCRDAQYPLQL